MIIEVINNVESLLPNYICSVKYNNAIVQKMSNTNPEKTFLEYDSHGLKDDGSQEADFSEEYLETGEFGDTSRNTTEGGKKAIFVNRYERDRKIRKECIKKYGYICEVCGMRFESKYGERGKGFIEVHHLKPLYTIKKEHMVNADELRPICSNCHSILHRFRDDMTIEQLRDIVIKCRQE